MYKRTFFLLCVLVSMAGNAQIKLPTVLGVPTHLDFSEKAVMRAKQDVVSHRERHRHARIADVRKYMHEYLALEDAKLSDLKMKTVFTKNFDLFDVHGILFQSQPGVYVPANLYVPKGDGPFPAIVNSHGHWPEGKAGSIVQQTAQLLAQNGYVVLNMDAWGAGERGTNHIHEYHGSNLGSALLDLGIPLMGMQVLDNVQGINLLTSLPYVDRDKIGATGASGGGNQTLWLGAYDDRVKSLVPVVSVGSMDAYIMNSNCVCELLPGGLTSMETCDVLASIYPRSINILTALRDGSATFAASEMIVSYSKAKSLLGDQINDDLMQYELFDEQHNYTAEMQQRMLTWFDRVFEIPARQFNLGYEELTPEDLSVGQELKWRQQITTTLDYVQKSANKLWAESTMSVLKGGVEAREKLSQIVKMSDSISIVRADSIGEQQGWQRWLLTINRQQMIPMLMRAPRTTTATYRVIFPSRGIQGLTEQDIDDFEKSDEGIVLVDLFGLGERSSAKATQIDGTLPRFHTLGRTMMWMGQNMIGQWADEIKAVIAYMDTRFPDIVKTIVADRETALAGLVYSAVSGDNKDMELEELPMSYIPSASAGSNLALDMSVHIQGIIAWGDVKGILSLSEAKISVFRPLNISGNRLERGESEEYGQQVTILKDRLGAGGKLYIK